MERIITLADKFLFTKRDVDLVSHKTVDFVKSRLRESRRFVLDNNAIIHFANVIKTVPDLLIREQQFARAPYDHCWVEFDFPLFHRTLVGHNPDEAGDNQIGYLVTNDSAYVIAGGEPPNFAVGLLPLMYELHQPWEIQDQLDFCSLVKTSRMQLDPLLWGQTYLKLSQDEQKSLRNHHTVKMLTSTELDPAMVFNHMLKASSGDLRNIVAILLLMNRPSLTKYIHEIGFRKHIYKGKTRQFLSHTTVTIPLDPIPTLRLLGTSQHDEVMRRRHEVRGHYCHNRDTKRNCIHEWERDPNYLDEDHWYCLRCNGHRWWRKHHERGTANIGVVMKDYKLTARKS